MDVEVGSRSTPEKFPYHPILDDSERMMKIIANPLYDKLTISRAAHIQSYNGSDCLRKKVRINIPKDKSSLTPIKTTNASEETTIPPLPLINNTTPQETSPKSQPKRSFIPPITIPRRSSTNRILLKVRKSSAHSRTSSVHSPFNESDKKPITDGTIRYVHTRHGFEVQRYSSSNWLSIDLFTKDACDGEVKTFREILDKKEQIETLNKSIYTSTYYRQRYEDLLQSYKDGLLTHDEWAKQDYQLYCLKTFYRQAYEREQDELELHQYNLRQQQAKCVFNQWKEAKSESHSDRSRPQLHSSNSQRATEVISTLSNPSISLPTNSSSISKNVENDFGQLPIIRFLPQSKNISRIPETSYMLDEQRWSLNAMLKRVVGLAEPLPPPPKTIKRRQSTLTHLSNDSGFESGH